MTSALSGEILPNTIFTVFDRFIKSGGLRCCTTEDDGIYKDKEATYGRNVHRHEEDAFFARQLWSWKLKLKLMSHGVQVLCQSCEDLRGVNAGVKG